MRLNSENGKAIWSKEKDPRITKIGKILRKSRIDEIPQLWNVIKNDRLNRAATRKTRIGK